MCSLRDGFCFAGTAGGWVRPCSVFHPRGGLLLPHGLGAVSLVVTARRLLFCQAGARPALFSLRGWFFFAPRARSGRSGCTSSAALRPAFACDRAGTSRGRAPRCSYEATPAIPHRGTPARDPHAPAPWLLSPAGRISLRRPRLPRSCTSRLALLALRPLGRAHRFAGGGIQSARRVPAAMSPETAGTQRADRDGVSVTLSHADTEGPWPGTRCWVAV